MTSAATQTGLTVRTFLLGSGSDDAAKIQQLLSEHDVVSRCGGDLTRLTQQGREAAEEQLASVTAGLLDLDLGDLLIGGWRTRERLIEAARQTRQRPGRREVVQLGAHRLTSTYNPTIELLVDGVKVHTFRFQLTVIFDIEVAALIVRDGLLTALKAGDGAVTCTLTLAMPSGDVELVNQQRKIHLHLIINIGHGIPLLPDGHGARPLRAGVGLAIGRLQPLRRDMGINLRRGRGGVAEDLLHAAQVGAPLKQVRSRGMPDGVRTRFPQPVMHDAACGPWVEPTAPGTEKERRPAALVRQHGTPGLLPAGQGPHRGQADRHDPFLAALAENPDGAPLLVESPDIELAQLADPDRRRVKQFKNRGIAHGQGRGGRLADGKLVPRAVLALREHQVHLFSAQHLRQLPPGLGGPELRSRVGREPAPPFCVRGEGTGRRTPPRQRGPRGACLMLARQPAPQRGQVERTRVNDAAPPRVVKKRLNVTLVGADGMPRQRTLCGKVPAKLSQRRPQRRGQAFGLAVHSLRARGMRGAVRSSGCSHGQKCVPGQATWE
jgi:hypothetical protein